MCALPTQHLDDAVRLSGWPCVTFCILLTFMPTLSGVRTNSWRPSFTPHRARARTKLDTCSWNFGEEALSLVPLRDLGAPRRSEGLRRPLLRLRAGHPAPPPVAPQRRHTQTQGLIEASRVRAIILQDPNHSPAMAGKRRRARMLCFWWRRPVLSQRRARTALPLRLSRPCGYGTGMPPGAPRLGPGLGRLVVAVFVPARHTDEEGD